MSDKLSTIRRDKNALKQELEAAGAQFATGGAVRCPFHDDKRPSAGIYQGQDGVWRFKCQACAAGGDIFDVRARATSKPLAEILLEAIGQFQGQSRSAKKQPLQNHPGNKMVYPDLDMLRAALPGQVVLEHIYVNPRTGEADLIVFRCHTQEGKSYRPACPVKGGFILEAPIKPWPLYNQNLINESDTVLVVEGEKCCDALARYGIVAVTNPFGSGKAEHASWTPLAGKNVVLWPDNDKVGCNHMRQVQAILDTIEPKPRTAWLEPSDLELAEKEDAADLIEQFQTLEKTDPEITTELGRIISKARPLGPLDKLHQRIRAITSGEYRAVRWPWQILTELTKALLPATITLLAGTVGASKSFMLLQAVLYWLSENENLAYYCLESDRAFHLTRALAQLSGTAGFTDPDWVVDNPILVETAIKEYSEELGRLSRHLWSSDNLGAETLEQLNDWIDAQAKLRRRIICLDPITAATRTSKPWIADLAFLKAAKRTAVDYGCSLLLVTHPTKETAEPTLQNLAGGACYQRFVDSVITLQNHEAKESRVKMPCGTTDTSHNRTVRIEKARNGKGTGCRLAYEFDRDSLTLKEIGIIMKTEGSW